MAKRYDIAIIGFTQTTDEARRDGVRDQRAVKGARSLPNKCDLGMVSFAPTKKELELLEEVIEKVGLNNRKCVPNICYSIYKNRGGKIKNIKIWGYQDLGTMEYIDLFCTDESYVPVNVDKTFLMPNLVDENVEIEIEEEPKYIIDEATGEIIDEDVDEVVDMSDFADFDNDDEEGSEDGALAEYQKQVEEYNQAMMEQYAGDESHVLQYDENGLLQAIPVEFEELAETEELEDPFADLPIIDDEDLDFLNKKPTLGKQRKGF